MGLLERVRGFAGAAVRFLSSGSDLEDTELGAADRQQERDKLFKIFTMGGGGGHGGMGGTTPGRNPPRNLPGGRPDQDDD